jgi:hypothetical protein
LSELGIRAIDLSYQESPYVDAFGNQFRYKARIWDMAGVTHDWCYDVTLQFGSFVKSK